MAEDLLAQAGFLRELFDAIPAMLLVVDDDVRILHVNETAAAGLGLDISMVRNVRGGEALHCVHATDVPAGCGQAPACRECVIRNAVALAAQGEKIFRRCTRMKLVSGGETAELHLVITAAPFLHAGRRFVLLTIENVSELMHLKGLLPICAYCKKIRDDEGYWKEIAGYFNTHLDINFTHGICTDCLAKHFPEALKQ